MATKGVTIEGSVVLEWLMAAYFHKELYYDELTRKNNTKGTGVKITNPNIKYKGFVLPGGSRSTKTWSIWQFLIYYCQINKNKRKDILVARQQYSNSKDSVMKDFFEILNLYGMYNIDNHLRSHPQKYILFGNTIHFSGLDSGGAFGKKFNVMWINEAFESDKEAFDQLEMRLTEFFIFDYNPVYTEHWILDSVVTRPNVWQAPISTQLHNKWLEDVVREKILSYDPNNPDNVRNGTADDYMWQVFGLGIGSKPEGVVFKYVDWIEEFPSNLTYWYGQDFGFVNDPTAIVKIGIKGKDLYLQELLYEPTETVEILDELMRVVGVSKRIQITADSSDKFVSAKYGAQEMVKDLRKKGWNIVKASKKGNKVDWIRKLNEYNMHIVQTTKNKDGNTCVTNFKKEQQNYRYRSVNGIQTNQPIDKWDHLWTATFYGAILKTAIRKLYWD